MRVHLFPSRTQKLSSFAPTIVAGWLAVKIGNANTNLHRNVEVFSYSLSYLPKTCPRHVSSRQNDSRFLAAKIGNANISLPEREGFFHVCYRICLKHAPGMLLRQNDSRFLTAKIGNVNISLPEKEGFFLVCYRLCLKLSCCNSGSVFAGHAPLANHLVAATPYCSLYLPQAALANVPPGMFFTAKR